MTKMRFSWGIREKLTLLFFAVTLIAVSVNFLLVVPRLESRLRNDRIKTMKRSAERFDDSFDALAASADPQLSLGDAGAIKWSTVLSQISSTTGNRVAMFKAVPAALPNLPTVQVYSDPSGEIPTSKNFADNVAARSIAQGKITTGLTEFGTGLHAEAASPIKVNGQSIGAVVYSTPLTNVTSIVRQQARRNLVAGVFALAISLLAGLLAARFIARRIKRLERAAREVARGNFTEPLPVDSKDELGELAQAFNNMQDRLGRADRARKAFIANASHELRTPLFSLGGYVELMLEEDLDAETRREFLETMNDQIHRMTKLATDLLDLSKLDTGSLDIRPESVDVEELARGIAREFEPQAARHESEITVSDGETSDAYCDPDRVAQIVRILVDNALSHTPAGTNIKIDTHRENGSVAVTVQDDGPGIDAENLPRIFDRFHTGDKTGGTGLGLSIANEIATAMDSTLKVQSQPQNTTFTLNLPVATES